MSQGQTPQTLEISYFSEKKEHKEKEKVARQKERQEKKERQKEESDKATEEQKDYAKNTEDGKEEVEPKKGKSKEPEWLDKEKHAGKPQNQKVLDVTAHKNREGHDHNKHNLKKLKIELAPNNLKQAIKLIKALLEQRRAQKKSDDQVRFKVLQHTAFSVTTSTESGTRSESRSMMMSRYILLVLFHDRKIFGVAKFFQTEINL